MPNTITRARIELAINWLAVVLAFCLPLFRRGVTITASLIILLWLLHAPWPDIRRTFTRLTPLLALAIFIFVNLISLLWSDNIADGFAYVLKYRYFLVLVALATTLRPKFRERTVVSFLSGYAISLGWSYGLAFGFFHFGKGSIDNPSPTMLHLDYSVFLAFTSLLIFNHIVSRSMNWKTRSGWILFLAISIGGLFINIGRSGQLAFAGTLLFLTTMLLCSRPVLLVLASLLGVVFFLVTVYWTVPSFKARFDTGVQEISGALTRQEFNTNQGKRVAGILVASGIVREHPILGTGVGDEMVEFRHRIDTHHPELHEAVYWFPHLHNQYLQIAVQLGAVGLIALVNIFVQLFRFRSSRPEWKRLATILGCVFLIAFVGDPFFHKQLTLVLFSLIGGLILAEKGNPSWSESAPAGDSLD
ncbi:MAG: O-antigen ligase family protein [bacterium]|nr:O-antigen ligase family protein [bacterium]